jgi:hypothetical protein
VHLITSSHTGAVGQGGEARHNKERSCFSRGVVVHSAAHTFIAALIPSPTLVVCIVRGQQQKKLLLLLHQHIIHHHHHRHYSSKAF